MKIPKEITLELGNQYIGTSPRDNVALVVYNLLWLLWADLNELCKAISRKGYCSAYHQLERMLMG